MQLCLHVRLLLRHGPRAPGIGHGLRRPNCTGAPFAVVARRDCPPALLCVQSQHGLRRCAPLQGDRLPGPLCCLCTQLAAQPALCAPLVRCLQGSWTVSVHVEPGGFCRACGFGNSPPVSGPVRPPINFSGPAVLWVAVPSTSCAPGRLGTLLPLLSSCRQAAPLGRHAGRKALAGRQAPLGRCARR